MAKVHRACRRVLSALEFALLEVGVLAVTDRGAAGWMKLPDIGFVSSRPSNCGTGMSSSVKLYLPFLSQTPSALNELCERAGAVAHWTQYSPLQRWKGHIVLYTAQSMGVTETRMVANLYRVVRAVVADEARLASVATVNITTSSVATSASTVSATESITSPKSSSRSPLLARKTMRPKIECTAVRVGRPSARARHGKHLRVPSL